MVKLNTYYQASDGHLARTLFGSAVHEAVIGFKESGLKSAKTRFSRRYEIDTEYKKSQIKKANAVLTFKV